MRKLVLIFVAVFSFAPVTARGEFVPTDVTGLQLWLDASDAATMLKSDGTAAVAGDLVYTWKDKSGNSKDATRSTAETEAPQLAASGVNGQPGLVFERHFLESTETGEQFTVSGGLPVATNSGRTVFMVFNYDPTTIREEWDYHIFGISNGQMIDVGKWCGEDSGASRLERVRFRNNSLNIYSEAGSVPAGDNLLTAMGDASGTQTWQGGEQILDTSMAAFSYSLGSNLGIGGAFNEGRTFVGTLSEILVYDSSLSEVNRQAVGQYLSDKYGLSYVPEPSTFALLLVGLAGLAIRFRRVR